MMTMERRALLQGMTGAAMISPFLAIEQAAAQVKAKIAPPTGTMTDDDHMTRMTDVFGPGVMGSERIMMLLYPGFTALDLVGPHYFFQCMFGAKVDLVTTEKTLAPVVSDLQLAISPTVTMADAAKDYDLIFVPGGTEGTLNVMRDAIAMAFIKDRASRAKHITSVCTGSMILGKAGLLKGKRATSHWAAHDALPAFGATPVDARVVTDGNITTGAGVSAGIDFGIAMVAALRGKPYAEALVLQAEYAPEPPFKTGTLTTAPADVGGVMSEMFEPLEGKFRALAND